MDGPDNFSVNSHRPLGRTVGRRCMLEARGYIVRSIVYFEWATFETPQMQQVLACLSSIVACVAWNPHAWESEVPEKSGGTKA